MSKKTSQKAEAVKILWAVGIFVSLVIVAFCVNVFLKKPVGPDNCEYTDKTLSHKAASDQMVLLIDQSEELSASHKRQVIDKIAGIITDDALLPIRSSVQLYVFGNNDFLPNGSGQNIEPIVSLCRPPVTGNPVYEGTKKIEKSFHARFYVPLSEQVMKALNASGGQRTPLLEVLQYISRTQDVKEYGNRHKKTLVLVTDLLQHSSAFTHYRSPASYEEFLRAAPSLKTSLAGWSVEILYLQRYGKDQQLQGNGLVDFWMRYFHEAGATVKRIDRLP